MAPRRDGEAQPRLLIVDLRIGYLIFRGDRHRDRRAIEHIDSPTLPQPAMMGLRI